SNLLQLMVDHIKQHLQAAHQTPEALDRRQRIFADPDDSVRAIAFRRERPQETMELITQRLREHTEEQRAPELDPRTEAMLLSGVTREASWLAIPRPYRDCELPIGDRIYRAMELIKNYTKGLEWELIIPPQARATTPVPPRWKNSQWLMRKWQRQQQPTQTSGQRPQITAVLSLPH